MSFRALPPRMRQLPPRKSAVLSVLDVGASKIVCLIARLTPMQPSDALARRAPIAARCSVSAISVRAASRAGRDRRSSTPPSSAIRLAVDAAERMAGVEVDSVIVNMSGGRLASQLFSAKIGDPRQGGRPSTTSTGCWRRRPPPAPTPGAPCCTLLPTGFSLDAHARRARSQRHGRRGARRRPACRLLRRRGGAQSDAGVERCHLRVEAMVATPYAAGLSTLVDDEAELGAALVDFGGGSTSVGVFSPAAGSSMSTPSPSAAIT